MKDKPVCYEPGRIIPELYSGVPTFAGVPRISTPEDMEGHDAIVFGMPWVTEVFCRIRGMTVLTT